MGTNMNMNMNRDYAGSVHGYGQDQSDQQPDQQPDFMYMGPADASGQVSNPSWAFSDWTTRDFLSAPPTHFQDNTHGGVHYTQLQPYAQAPAYDSHLSYARAQPPPRPPDPNEASPFEIAPVTDTLHDFSLSQPEEVRYPYSPYGAQHQSLPQSQYPLPPSHDDDHDLHSATEHNPQALPNAPAWNHVVTRSQGNDVTASPSDPGDPGMLSPYYPSSTAASQADQPSQRAATSNLDGVSRRSDRSDNRSETSEQYFCEPCNVRMSIRCRKRHMLERHSAATPSYTCACSKQTTRCSNHTRHMRSCSKRASSLEPYICCCGREDDDNSEHVQHIEYCSKDRPGRRPRSGSRGRRPNNSRNRAEGR